MPEERSARPLPLPDEAFDDLALIVGNADKLAEICECVAQTRAVRNLKSITASVFEKTGLPERQAKSIVGALLALHQLRSRLELDGKRFLEGLGSRFAEMAREKGQEELIESWEKGFDTIRQVFDEGSAFGILNKATELVYSHQNVFTDARLLTDVRPVYDQDAQKILRMVVTHQLILDYVDGRQHKRLYVAVDATDLTTLEEQCKRARDKASVASRSLDDLWPTSVIGESDE